ncbi:hypothetical protein M434DRAFT_28411 [Hypoxylon sp. CO27-5]|nr:hypothetical protein M434DRAFT_28411 [Hypoxylon sp. CO27-5]
MSALWLLICYIFVANVQARYMVACKNTNDHAKITNAVNEASQWALNAISAIQNLNHDTTKAAFNPLFQSSDVQTLTMLYTGVRDIASNSIEVKIYCKEDHVKWSDKYGGWADMDYTYRDNRGVTQRITNYYIDRSSSSRSDRSPGSKGSYTTIGYRMNISPGLVADCSNQAHIYVNPTRVNPPPNTPYDHRSLDLVRREGLKSGYTALDTLKPLAETIFHELMHVLGGHVDINTGRQRITDGPNKDTYKYAKCVALNANRSPHSTKPTEVAECPMILAKALYLSTIKGKPVFWSKGAVNRDTGKP